MSQTNAPKDGDFAAYLERQAKAAPKQPADASEPLHVPDEPGLQAPPPPPTRQTIVDVLMGGEEPTDELLEDMNIDLPPLSDEELERQALLAPGADGDPGTPE